MVRLAAHVSNAMSLTLGIFLQESGVFDGDDKPDCIKIIFMHTK